MQSAREQGRVRAFQPRLRSYVATPRPRTPLSRRHPQGHAPCLRLWRRCRVCRAAALQPAGAQQRVRPRQPGHRHRRGACTGQALLRGGQHCAAQRQAEDLSQGPGAGGGDGAGCADHVRSGPDHAGARALPADAGAPVGAGQCGELGQRGVLAPPGALPGDPVARAGAGGDRGYPPAGAGHGTGSVRPRRAVHGLFRALPAVRLHQQARPQPGYLHQRLPLEVPGP